MDSARALFGHTVTLTTRPTPPHRVFPYQPPFAFYPAFGFYPLGFYGGGFCDPFWGLDPAFGCGGIGGGFGFGFGYGYGGYWAPGYYDNSYGVGGSSGPMDYQNDASSNSFGTYSPAPNQAPDQSTDQSAPPAGAPASETDLYFKDGTSLEVLSYWLDAGKLHYITNYNGEMTIDLSQVDLQRTVDENARHGVDFTLRPNPSAPAQTPAAPNQQPAPN
jgi:hypothetical protein